MFENCGSSFAAEQFVDIKLGAKDFLTLTSLYQQKKRATGTNKKIQTGGSNEKIRLFTGKRSSVFL